MNLSPTDQKLQLRLLGAILAFSLSADMLTGALWVLATDSVTWRVAQLASFPTAIAWLWCALALLVVPYLLVQLFDWFDSYRIRVTRLACYSILMGGVVWVYLAYLSKNLDYKYVTGIFTVTGLINVAMAFVLALGLNAAQKHAAEGGV